MENRINVSIIATFYIMIREEQSNKSLKYMDIRGFLKYILSFISNIRYCIIPQRNQFLDELILSIFIKLS